MNRIGITSLKGGVGKTTLTALLGLYFSNTAKQQVLIVDMDHQAGATSLFYGGSVKGYSVFDFLRAVLDGEDSGTVIEEMVSVSPYNENIFVIPANVDLLSLNTMGAPIDLLDYALQEAEDVLPKDIVVLIDTGTEPFLGSMGITASDHVLVPVMLSRQAIKPTASTLTAVARAKRKLAGLVPVMLGNTQWETSILESWESKYINKLGGQIYPGLPTSRVIQRGKWVASGIPEVVFGPIDNIAKSLLKNEGGGVDQK